MKRLVLEGGGHAHLQVLKAMAAQRWPEAEVTLISPYSRQIYSGILPGGMAGHYSLEQCAASIKPLVDKSESRFIQDIVIALNADRRIVYTAHSGEIAFDVLSHDTGALVDSSFLAAT